MSNTVTIRLNLKLDKKNQNEVEKLLGSLSKGKTVPVKINTTQLQKGLQGALTSVKSFSDGLYKSFSQFGLATSGFKAAIGMVKGAVDPLVRASNVQEDAITSLKAALRNTGVEVDVTSGKLQAYASSLQDVTRYGDEAILAGTALAQNIGKFAADQLPKVQKAAIGLAATYKMDLKTAFELLGRASKGQTSTLTRYGVVLDTTKSKEEQFAELLLKGADGFSIAQEEAENGAGALQQYANLVGDLQESLGALLKKALVPMAQYLGTVVKGLTSFFDRISHKSEELNSKLSETIGLETKTIAQYKMMSKELLLLAQKKDKNSFEQERYNTLVREMNTQYGKYLPNLITEKTTYFDLAANIKTATGNLEQYFQAKRKEAVTADIQGEMDKLNKRNELLKYGLELQKAGEIVVFKDDDGYERSTAQVQKEIEQNNLQLKAMEQRYKRAAGAIDETDRAIIRLYDDAGNGDTDTPAPLDPKEIDKAKQSMDAFFLSISSKRNQLEAEYKDRKSLLEVAYAGDPEGLQSKITALDAWYQAEQAKITASEKKAAEDAATAAIRAKEKEYQTAIALLEAKKQLGLDVTDELAAVQADYTAWLAVTYGKDSAAYIAALQQKQDANMAFWQKTHKLTTAYMDALLDGFTTAWNSILDASMTGSERFNAIWGSIKQSFMNATGEMVADYFKKKWQEVVITEATEKAKTNAQRAGILERVALDVWAGLKFVAIKLYEIAAAITKYYSFLGPFAPAATAGTMLGIVKLIDSFKNGFYAGGWTGDGDARNEAGVVHKREIVFESGIAVPNKNSLLWLRGMMQRGFSLPELMRPVMPMMAFPALAGGGSDSAVLDRLDKIERAITEKRFEGDFRLKDDRTATNRYKVHLEDKASYERRVK